MIRIKRVFDKRSEEDGYRVLVDRKWPLGIRKESAALDYWAKELAPTDQLREFYQHDPKRWLAFRARFREELKAPAALKTLTALARMSKSRTVTLVFGTREEKRNAASVVSDALESLLQNPLPAPKDSHAHSTKRRDRALLKALKGARLMVVFGLAAGFGLAAIAARADGDQSDVISAHGDARAEAKPAEELVKPMPAVPPNSAPPVVPSSTPVVAAPGIPRPAAVLTSAPVVPERPHASGGQAPATLTDNGAAAAPAAPPAGQERRDGHAILIIAGAVLALAMFLWERRRKD